VLNATLSELGAALRARKVSALELARAHLDRIARLDKKLNAFITVDEAGALAAAKRADARLAKGEQGPLVGIPIAHKDLFVTRGTRTTCGSRMLEHYVSPFDAHVVERLAAAGMVQLGKCNMDEFAMGSSSESSCFGPVRNPWDTSRVPGGSSGGSAAAVAARLAPAATGTDTGGSIRQPAAMSGVCGLKPTYGAVSRYGMVAFASSLDQGGPIARSAADLALLMNAMAGFDPRDSTSVERRRIFPGSWVFPLRECGSVSHRSISATGSRRACAARSRRRCAGSRRRARRSSKSSFRVSRSASPSTT
jgi:aspartyl-tRNA(Asn)/glutamyl-tRNA(Gln) amidotransferase subunit A